MKDHLRFPIDKFVKPDQTKQLIDALRPFVEAYNKAADHIGDSDLYPEQPRSVHVTLGDCRKAALLLATLDK